MKKLPHKPKPVKPAKKKLSLKSFDFTDDAFAKITKDAHAERTRLSVHAPKNAGGLTFYIWFVSLLREHLIGLNRGWVGRTVDGLEIVENEDRKIRIAYVQAESLDQALITSHRGPASLAAAYRNGQLPLFGAEYLAAQPREPTGNVRPLVKFQTWFVAVQPMRGAYRLELALPTDHAGGRFTEWAERIAIAEVPLDSEPKLDVVVEGAQPVTATPKAKRRRETPQATDKPANDVTGTDKQE